MCSFLHQNGVSPSSHLDPQPMNMVALRRCSREFSRKMKDGWARGAAVIGNSVLLDKRIRPFLVLVLLLAWSLKRWLISLSSWVPVYGAVWAVFQYGQYKRNVLLEDLNNRWKRHILHTSPKTPLEPCEWLNKLMMSLWPSYMKPKLSKMFSEVMLKRLKEKKPQPFGSIELQEFQLGISPPALGLQRTSWSIEGDEQVLHMGFEWDTNDMKVLLAAKLARPFKGIARFVINSIHIKGDLRIVPILDGQAVVYSFQSPPEVRVGLAFGGGSQSLPATELPLVAPWLEKLFSDTLSRTMVEPQRRCFPLPTMSMKKHVTGGIITVTVLSADNLALGTSSKRLSDRRLSTNGSSSTSGSNHSKQMRTFVEVTLEGLTRKTHVYTHRGSPSWNDTFNMILHESAGTIYFSVYEQGSSNVKYDFLGSCQVRVKHVNDGSTIFWTAGSQNSVLADRAENCGKDVLMKIPIAIEGYADAKLSVKLLVKEWQFKDGSRTEGAGVLTGSLSSVPSFEAHTGRTLKITVMEGRNLAAKDRSGTSDPYVRLQYGKVQRKTKTVKQDLNPSWKEAFEFPEIGDSEYLQLKCYDSDYLTDEKLGSARVNLEGLEDSISRDVWIPLEKISTGEIRLIIEAHNSDSELEILQIRSKEEENMNLKKGILEVVLLEARDLVAADWRGTSDPFVSVHCGTEKRMTKVIQKTLCPQWNQTLELSDTGKPLVLYVKDHNILLPSSNIGHCKVEYERLPTNQTVDKWIPLQGVKTGEIHVQVTRRIHKFGRQSSIYGNTDSKLLKKSGKVRNLLKEVRSFASRGDIASREDIEAICKKLEEIEVAEDEKGTYISQLIRDKELLLSKIKELGKAMEGIQENP